MQENGHLILIIETSIDYKLLDKLGGNSNPPKNRIVDCTATGNLDHSLI